MNQIYKVCSQIRTSKCLKKRNIIRRYSRDIDGIEKPLNKSKNLNKTGKYAYKALNRDISDFWE